MKPRGWEPSQFNLAVGDDASGAGQTGEQANETAREHAERDGRVTRFPVRGQFSRPL
jgi:hypothetical protein